MVGLSLGLILCGGRAGAQFGSQAPASPFARALEQYSELTQRTILSGPHPRAETLRLPESPLGEPAAALAALKAAIEQCGVDLVEAGDRFVLVLPKSRRQLEEDPFWLGLKSPPTGGAGPATNVVNFPLVDVNTALEFSAAFMGRTVLRPSALPAGTFSLHTRTALTRDELVYALRVVFALHGYALILDGERFLIVAKLAEASRLKPSAPAAQPGERTYAPDELPRFNVGSPPMIKYAPPPPGRDSDLKAELQWQYELLPRQLGAKPRGPLERMIYFYASLSGQTWETGQLANHPVEFVPVGPLTKPELLYGIRTALYLNNLHIVAGQENRFHVLSEREFRDLALPHTADPGADPHPPR